MKIFDNNITLTDLVKSGDVDKLSKISRLYKNEFVLKIV